MPQFGRISSYDIDRGSGTISPETGGAPLPFAKADLELGAQLPRFDQRYGYETSEVNGGNKRAIFLHPQPGEGDRQREQAIAQRG